MFKYPNTEIMEDTISRSEKKRRFKAIEQLAMQLTGLSVKNIAQIPCESFVRDEILKARDLKGGAKKRQVKHIAKLLRQGSTDELLTFLQEQEGSQLKKDRDLHELERIRDAIINEAIEAHKDATADSLGWSSKLLVNIKADYPGLDDTALERAAWRYASTRKTVYAREIFRMLKASADRLQFEKSGSENNGI